MKGGGRYSSVALATKRPGTQVIERIRPPHHLNDEECVIWRICVDAHPADWFAAGGSALLLAQFCRHTVIAKRIAEMIEQTIDRATADELDLLFKMQERETRTISSLATKLRMTPQATLNHRGNKKPVLQQHHRVPWEESEDA